MQGVPVPKSPMPKGTIVSEAHLFMKELPASQIYASTLTETAQITGLQTTRALAAGRPINKLHLRIVPLIEKGSAVTFSYQRGPIQLSGTAQALEDGLAGQTIRLLNPETRATLTGTILPNGDVVVN